MIGRSPREAETLLGYPDAPPVRSDIRLVKQDATVDMAGRLIVTAVCYMPEPDGMIVFEVADRGRMGSVQTESLKHVVYESRVRNIEQETGCRSDFVGIPVDTP